MDELGYDEALRACERSLKRLGRDCIDLYLIHWPQAHLGLHVDTWRALIRLREEGKVKSIGVSNFHIQHLQDLIAATGVVPVLNQVELHPYFQQKALREFHHANGIATQGWSPLGRGAMLQDPIIVAIAAKHQCTPAQVVLRWHLQLGCAVIPKASSAARLQENWEAQNLRLDAVDMAQIAAMDRADGRAGPDPDNVEAWLNRRS
jgi:2,5-diketo-D-gluconate reductase A